MFKALTLNKVPFKKRELRVSTCGKRTKRSDFHKTDETKDVADVSADEAPKKKVKKVKELKGAARRVEARVNF